MRAVQLDRFGGPEVMELREVDRPAPVPTEVLVRVHAAGVNPVDWKTRAAGAFLGSLGSAPYTLGWDVSGVVEEVGGGVSRFQPGDEVYGMPRFPWQAGAYADYVTAPSRHFAPKPAGLSHEEAAALPLAGLTAWQALVDTADVQEGQRVLVHAAAGGVGTVVGQIARRAGAGRVLGVVSTAAKAAFAERFGYDEVLVGERWDEQARAATRGRGLDVVLDSIGGTVRERSFELLAPLGRIVFYGNACDEPEVGFPGSRLRGEVKSTLGFSITALAAAAPERARALAERALAAVARGQLEVPITDVLPLEQAPQAHRLLEGRMTTGKLVLEVAPR